MSIRCLPSRRLLDWVTVKQGAGIGWFDGWWLDHVCKHINLDTTLL